MDATKSVKGHVMANLYFFYPMGSVGHKGHSSASGAQNVDALSFILKWDRYGINKKCTEKSYAKLMLLHPVGSVGHVVHSSASSAPNIDALFFMLG
jgi:hypothetical protein